MRFASTQTTEGKSTIEQGEKFPQDYRPTPLYYQQQQHMERTHILHGIPDVSSRPYNKRYIMNYDSPEDARARGAPRSKSYSWLKLLLLMLAATTAADVVPSLARVLCIRT